MQFRHQNILHITPPKAQTAGPNKMTQEILIGIDQAGQYFYNDTQVSSGELEQALSIAGQADGAQSVLVLADEESPLKHMTYVMDVSRKSGLEKVRLQTRQ